MNSRGDLNEADLICPLSQQIFLDPVKIPVEPLKQPDGTIIEKYITVERQMIEKWINENGKNPFTRKPLKLSELKPDDEMKNNVNEFLEKNPGKKDVQYSLQAPSISTNSDRATRPSRPSDPTPDDFLAINEAQRRDQRNPLRQYLERSRRNLEQLRDPRILPIEPTLQRTFQPVSEAHRTFHSRRGEGLTNRPSRESATQGLNADQQQALEELRDYGLTEAHIRSIPWNQNPRLVVNQYYRYALVNLMTERGANNKTADEAVTELNGLNYVQAQGISKGLNRYDVLDLDEDKIKAFLKLRQYGLTTDHLRTCIWNQPIGDIQRYYPRALKNLMTRRGTNNRTADQAVAELNGLDYMQAEGISKGLERADVLGLDEDKIKAFLELRAHGLTIDHLRSSTWNQRPGWDVNRYYRHALVNLMTERGANNRTADQAVAELNGLDYMQAEGISKGLERADVLGLDEDKIKAFLELRAHGLTIDHLRSSTWDQRPGFDVNQYYRHALVNLMTERGTNNRTADQAVAELNGLDYMQAQGVSRGLNRADVLGLDRQKIEVFLKLRQHGLTTDHLRSCNWPQNTDEIYYCFALENLMIERGANNKTAEQAIAEMNGLDVEQVRRITRGETREQVLHTLSNRPPNR